MTDDVIARLRDRLPVNPPDAGITAEGYDAWIPVDEPLPEEPVYASLLGLIDDPERAADALASWFVHLRPGGLLALTAFFPRADFPEVMGGRVRRTGTTADGRTIVVHEATRCDVDVRSVGDDDGWVAIARRPTP